MNELEKLEQGAEVLMRNLARAPIPMLGPINTPGAEDSPFILPCGCDFYFVFVPDVRIPPEKN